MKKKLKVIMLPTEESPIKQETNGTNSKLWYIGRMDMNYINSEYHTPQHLYLVSDEEIKEGDWTIDVECNLPHGRLTSIDNQLELKEYASKPEIWKVIATTDSSLEVGECSDKIELWGKSFPKIPESFIKYFVEKNGDVDYVEVEYKVERWAILTYGTVGECSGHEIEEKLKLTDNNEVIIHLPKEKMYSIKEIESMHLSIIKQGCLYEGGEWSDEHERLVKLEFNKWIEKNL